jgi:hypothetical protein
MRLFKIDWGCETNGSRQAVVLVDDGNDVLCNLYDTLDDIGDVSEVTVREIDAANGVYFELDENAYEVAIVSRKKPNGKNWLIPARPAWRKS